MPNGLVTRGRRPISELSAAVRSPSSKRLKNRSTTRCSRHHHSAPRPQPHASCHMRRTFRPKSRKLPTPALSHFEWLSLELTSTAERVTMPPWAPSASNPPDDDRLAQFRNVPDPELLTRLGLFVAEGRLVVTRLLASRLQTQALLVTEPALASLRDRLVDQTFPVYLVPQAVMDGVTGFHFHRGCLAIGVRPPARHWREVMSGARRLVVLERVGNVDNVGRSSATPLRSAWMECSYRATVPTRSTARRFARRWGRR